MFSYEKKVEENEDKNFENRDESSSSEEEDKNISVLNMTTHHNFEIEIIQKPSTLLSILLLPTIIFAYLVLILNLFEKKNWAALVFNH